MPVPTALLAPPSNVMPTSSPPRVHDSTLGLASLLGLRCQSDTLETRTKLTSHSALESSGLLERSLPNFTS